FLVACAGDLPVLHSFPTRRSSDLCPVAVIPIGLVSGGNFHADVQAGTVSGASGPAQSLPMVWIRQPADHGVTVTQFQNLAAQPEDRKSTRLNSSHVKISYAVFCLK